MSTPTTANNVMLSEKPTIRLAFFMGVTCPFPLPSAPVLL
ncbi:hypothetical protein HMPREF3212_04782 [Citrobacter freundii]|nr:hypothetical protein HMPREF3212_04782 [Citrobacter freundii]